MTIGKSVSVVFLPVFVLWWTDLYRDEALSSCNSWDWLRPHVSLNRNKAGKDKHKDGQAFRKSGSAIYAKFSGAYVIKKKLNDTDYIICTPDRKRKSCVCQNHMIMLKSYEMYCFNFCGFLFSN